MGNCDYSPPLKISPVRRMAVVTGSKLGRLLFRAVSPRGRRVAPNSSRFSAESHTAAIDRIEKIVGDENLDCDFARVDGYLFLPPGGSVTDLKYELDAALRAGLLEVQRVDRIPIGKFTTDGVLRFPRQAQFHPLKYLNGLVRATIKRGGRIFTGTRVVKVEDGDPVRIETSKGHSIRAEAAIVATNCPINDRLVIHSKQAPYVTYVLALRVTREIEQ